VRIGVFRRERLSLDEQERCEAVKKARKAVRDAEKAHAHRVKEARKNVEAAERDFANRVKAAQLAMRRGGEVEDLRGIEGDRSVIEAAEQRLAEVEADTADLARARQRLAATDADTGDVDSRRADRE
jgi:phage-related tail protein